jgi:hypothetical protein
MKSLGGDSMLLAARRELRFRTASAGTGHSSTHFWWLNPVQQPGVLSKCDRSSSPVSVRTNTLWPSCSSRSATRRQIQPPRNASKDRGNTKAH